MKKDFGVLDYYHYSIEDCMHGDHGVHGHLDIDAESIFLYNLGTALYI